MTINDWLGLAKAELNKTEKSSTSLDAILLIEKVTGKNRAWLYANLSNSLTPVQVKQLNMLLKKRMQHEPMAYILQSVEFYGRTYLVSNKVLVPRPESEDMIDLLKELVNALPQDSKALAIGDIGTGCGNLGITAALELAEAVVELVDINPAALKVARTNVDKFTLDIKCLKSNLLNSASTKYDILLCNLPYVPDDMDINLAARHEPRIALFGGPDGLDLYRKLFQQIDIRQNKPLYLLFESFPYQHEDLSIMAAKYGYDLHKSINFIQLFSLKIDSSTSKTE